MQAIPRRFSFRTFSPVPGLAGSCMLLLSLALVGCEGENPLGPDDVAATYTLIEVVGEPRTLPRPNGCESELLESSMTLQPDGEFAWWARAETRCPDQAPQRGEQTITGEYSLRRSGKAGEALVTLHVPREPGSTDTVDLEASVQDRTFSLILGGGRYWVYERQ